MYNHGEENDE